MQRKRYAALLPPLTLLLSTGICAEEATDVSSSRPTVNPTSINAFAQDASDFAKRRFGWNLYPSDPKQFAFDEFQKQQEEAEEPPLQDDLTVRSLERYRIRIGFESVEQGDPRESEIESKLKVGD